MTIDKVFIIFLFDAQKIVSIKKETRYTVPLRGREEVRLFGGLLTEFDSAAVHFPGG